ncbi:MAG: zinc-ribbon domain-containing protein, partial [Spirochaetales bacterium]|nr:zinc-ribbon domain-containing protein [Spirochaetales bacterium]
AAEAAGTAAEAAGAAPGAREAGPAAGAAEAAASPGEAAEAPTEDEVEEGYECPECGAPIDTSMTACPNCGVGLSFEEEADEETEGEADH